MTNMEEGIYMKPIVAASQESLTLAGKQLIESHVYTMCGVVNVDEPKEVVIYIIHWFMTVFFSLLNGALSVHR